MRYEFDPREKDLRCPLVLAVVGDFAKQGPYPTIKQWGKCHYHSLPEEFLVNHYLGEFQEPKWVPTNQCGGPPSLTRAHVKGLG